MRGTATTPVSSKNCRYTIKTPKESDIPVPDTIEIDRRPILVNVKPYYNKIFRNLSKWS